MNIIVTGASKGIGYEIVKSLVRKKNCFILSLSRNERLLANLKEECTKLNTNSEIIPFSFDLTKCIDNSGILLEKVLKYFKHIDVLVNNAGYLMNKPFLFLFVLH